jgi:CheY-like chemotaxis protein
MMISGHGQEVGDARARAAGADVFLAKPFSLEQLRSALAKLLGAA